MMTCEVHTTREESCGGQVRFAPDRDPWTGGRFAAHLLPALQGVPRFPSHWSCTEARGPAPSAFPDGGHRHGPLVWLCLKGVPRQALS